MAQMPSRPCPHCGNLVAPGQRFCSNCGTTMDMGFANPTAAASGSEHIAGVPEAATQLPVPPPLPVGIYNQNQTPPPPPPTYYPSQGPQAQQGFPQSQQVPQGYPQGQQPLAPVAPSYARPQKDASKGVLGQIGCGVLAVILIIVLLVGGASFGLYWFISHAGHSGTTNNNTTTGNTVTTGNNATTGTNGNTGNSGTPTAIPLLTAQINQSVTYASDQITITSVQEASSYSDDATPNSPVTLRINMKEQNSTSGTIFPSYGDSFRLILPDKTSVAPGQSQLSAVIDQAVSRTNWIDFPLQSSIPIAQLTLQLGKSSEAQEVIPLTGTANLTQYQDKTITPNTLIKYAGVNWTLTSVTSSLSSKGTQANTGMRFIVVTLKLDNTSSNTYFPDQNNFRLQGGGLTSASVSNTLPPPISSGVTGQVGTITFQVTQASGSFTLVFLAQPTANPPVSQETTTFQI